MSVGYLGTLMLCCVGLGWWARGRAPDGVDARYWFRRVRRLRRWRANVA